MSPDEPNLVDYKELAARGWTRSLIDRFLGMPDEWRKVDHWLNYQGKALYEFERVMLTELTLSFKSAFGLSVKRRKLSIDAVRAINEERARRNSYFREWLTSHLSGDSAYQGEQHLAAIMARITSDS